MVKNKDLYKSMLLIYNHEFRSKIDFYLSLGKIMSLTVILFRGIFGKTGVKLIIYHDNPRGKNR